MSAQLELRIKKVRAFAEHARDSFESALFQIAALGPLITSKQIIEPLSNTYAANTLNMLQWTLYSQASINLCKSLFDRDQRSGSLTLVLSMIESNDLSAALRAAQAVPTRSASPRQEFISAVEWEEIEQARMDRDRREAEARFDNEVPHLHKDLAKLREADFAQRVLKARDKVLAHGELRFNGQDYERTRPEDFDLKWGDPAALAKAGGPLIEKTFSTLFAHGYSLDQSREVLEGYSLDFWRHLEIGLSAGPTRMATGDRR